MSCHQEGFKQGCIKLSKNMKENYVWYQRIRKSYSYSASDLVFATSYEITFICISKTTKTSENPKSYNNNKVTFRALS